MREDRAIKCLRKQIEKLGLKSLIVDATPKTRSTAIVCLLSHNRDVVDDFSAEQFSHLLT